MSTRALRWLRSRSQQVRTVSGNRFPVESYQNFQIGSQYTRTIIIQWRVFDDISTCRVFLPALCVGLRENRVSPIVNCYRLEILQIDVIGYKTWSINKSCHINAIVDTWHMTQAISCVNIQMLFKLFLFTHFNILKCIKCFKFFIYLFIY